MDVKRDIGAGWFLVTQLLFGVLVYVGLSVYPHSRSIALALGFFIVAGMIYSGWRGMQIIWKR